MSKFKVGDKVKVVKRHNYFDDSEHLYNSGTVTRVDTALTPALCEVELINGDVVRFAEYQLEHVTEKSELENLVDQVNKGKAALRKIRESYPNKTQFRIGSTIAFVVKAVPTDGSSAVLEIIPEPEKPKFEPFITVNGLVTVSMSRDLSEVQFRYRDGSLFCKSYPTRDVIDGLMNLLRHEGSQYLAGEFAAHVTRVGIKILFMTLSWEDAEKLLQALEELNV